MILKEKELEHQLIEQLNTVKRVRNDEIVEEMKERRRRTIMRKKEKEREKNELQLFSFFYFLFFEKKEFLNCLFDYFKKKINFNKDRHWQLQNGFFCLHR